MFLFEATRWFESVVEEDEARNRSRSQRNRIADSRSARMIKDVPRRTSGVVIEEISDVDEDEKFEGSHNLDRFMYRGEDITSIIKRDTETSTNRNAEGRNPPPCFWKGGGYDYFQR